MAMKFHISKGKIARVPIAQLKCSFFHRFPGTFQETVRLAHFEFQESLPGREVDRLAEKAMQATKTDLLILNKN